MYEPMTAVTDFVLCGISLFLGFKLLDNAVKNNIFSQFFLGLALGFIGLAALVGGFIHGFIGPDMPSLKIIIWKITMLLIGAAGYGLMNVVVVVLISSKHTKEILTVGFLVMFAAYFCSVVLFYNFTIVIAWLMLTLTSLLLFSLKKVAGRWGMLCGTLITGLGLSLWSDSVAINLYINHNDLYHIIQMVAVIFFYAGGKKLRDA